MHYNIDIHLVTHKKVTNVHLAIHKKHNHALSIHSILLSTRNITIHHPCIIHALCIHALSMQQSCYPQEYKHALSMRCHPCIIHAFIFMHSYSCIFIYAFTFMPCHSSCCLQDHKHTTTFVLLCARSHT